MGTVDASIVNIAYPALTDVFKTTPATVLWVGVAYMLVSTGLMLTLGRISDAMGRKRLYILGFLIFSIGLSLCSLAQSINQLILFRIIQAIGSAMTVATSSAIITDAFPVRERGKALGIMGGAISAGFASGPVLGGLLLDPLGWRALFYVRIPIGIIGLVVAWFVLKESVADRKTFKLDLRGSATLFGGMACLLLGVNQGSNLGWTSLPILGLFSGTAIFFTFFILTERKASQPIVDLKLFKNRLFTASSGSLVLFFLAYSAYSFLVPFYLISGVGYPTMKAGLLLTTVPLITIVLGPISGWLSDRFGSRLLAFLGMAFYGLGLFLLSGLSQDSTAGDIVVRLTALGIGSALFNSPNNSAIMGSVSRERLGTASAMISTLRQVGMSIGIALAEAIFTLGMLSRFAILQSSGLSLEMAKSKALVGGFQDATLIASGIAILGALTSLVSNRRVAIPARGVKQSKDVLKQAEETPDKI